MQLGCISSSAVSRLTGLSYGNALITGQKASGSLSTLIWSWKWVLKWELISGWSVWISEPQRSFGDSCDEFTQRAEEVFTLKTDHLCSLRSPANNSNCDVLNVQTWVFKPTSAWLNSEIRNFLSCCFFTSGLNFSFSFFFLSCLYISLCES